MHAWVFPGQGSQVVGMGKDLSTSLPSARAFFEEADAILDTPISRICFEGPEEQLNLTEYTQPALLTVSVGLLRALQELAGAKLVLPGLVAGHSLGEYSALVAAGVLDFPTALRLVQRRGELMAQARNGAMAAVLGLDELVLRRICTEVTSAGGGVVVIANDNAPGQIIISGERAAVEQAGTMAKEHGAKRVMPLNVSGAFHSPLMKDAASLMTQALSDPATVMHDSAIPVIANVTAQPIQKAGEIRLELAEQIVAPVRWTETVRTMVAHGVTTFVEIGPKNVLTGLIRRIAPEAQTVNIATWDDLVSYSAV